MLKNNKWKLIVSSILILLPILAGLLLWNDLPNNMVTHWGADGNADGMTPKHIAVFLIPTLLLGVQWLFFWATSFDKKQKEQNQKALRIIFWIMPALSIFINGMMYSVALGNEFSAMMAMPILFGILFVYIGNYMPKVKQNRSLGIKISWTLNNEENWSKTHRFAGKIWVIGGLCMLIFAFFPVKLMIAAFVAMLFCLIFLPFLYSYSIYRKHKKEGVDYTAAPKSKAEKIATRISAVIVPLILIAVAVIMFVGEINLTYGENAFTVSATFWSDSEIEYDTIKDIRYKESGFSGYRVSGFGSAKLSLGQFQNQEFGNYISYIYNSCDACVVLYGEDAILILNGPDSETTKTIYETLQEKIK